MKHLPLKNLLLIGSIAALGGCFAPQEQSAQQSRDEARRVAQESKAVVSKSNDAFGQGVITTKDSTLQGNDAKGRLQWRLSFKEGRLNNAAGTTKSSSSTRSGDLLGANAELFKNGKTESVFRAAKMKFDDTQRGLMLTMTGGVGVQTSAQAKAKSAQAKSAQKILSEKVNISAPTVSVDVKARKMRASGGVRMTQGKTSIAAPQLAADTGLSIARIGGGIVANAPQGRISAQNAVWNWKTRRVQANGKVEVSPLNNATSKGAKISGARLDADTNASRGSLSGGVRASSADGATANANRVLFNWQNNTISARDDVTLQKDGATVRAARIDTDSQLNRAQATGGVTLQKDGATIFAANVDAFERATRVVASGDVRATRAGETLRANRATVWINEKRANASGNVTLARADGTLRADNASYWQDGRATANGNVKLVRPDATIRADKAQYWTDGRAVANGDVTLTRAGATLRADNAQIWKSGRAIASGGVRLVRDDVTILAPRLESENISDKTRTRVLASGGVVTRGRGGEVRAQSVTWSNAGAIANGGVRLIRGGNTLRGARLQSDAAFAKVVVSGNVGGTLSNGATFTSGALQWTRVQNGKTLANNGRVVAQGGVTMRQNNLRLRGARLNASGDGRNATLSGNVVADDSKGATVRAQTVRYDAANQKIFASGQVFYRDANGNTLRGTNLIARIVGGSLKDATMLNVRGTTNFNLFQDSKLFND